MQVLKMKRMSMIWYVTTCVIYRRGY